MRLAVTVAVLVATAAGPAAAQVPLGSERQVNTFTTGDQTRPAVTRLSSGDFVVVWDSQHQDDPAAAAVRGQRFDASGNKRGAEFAINTFTTGDQSEADVAATPDGGFIVTWQGSGAQGSGVYARRFSASGAGGPEFQVTSSSRYPAVAVSAAGQCTSIWQLAFSWHANGDIKARQFSSAGTPIGDELLVASHGNPGDGVLERPDIAWLAKGLPSGADGYVVVWGHTGPNHPVWRRERDLGTNQWLDTYTLGTNGRFPSVSADAAGRYVVAWSETASLNVVKAQGFNPDGTQNFPITTVGTATAIHDRIGLSTFPTGEFAVTWGDQNGDASGRLFNSAGTALTSAFRVNTYTTGGQFKPVVATGAGEGVLVTWVSQLGQDGHADGIFAQAYGRLQPFALAVDASGNQVLDPGETAVVAPTWRNLTTSPVLSFTGTATFTGPSGFTYSTPDPSALYASIPAGATGSCGSDCYAVSVTGTRPAPHVDATMSESIAAAIGAQPWTLHVGGSFTDVPKQTGAPPVANPYYRFVETLLHRGVTSGCTPAGTTYCPNDSVTREQMAAFLLLAKEGSGYQPPACVPPNLFTDVPESSPFCRYIEELVNRGITGGCGTGTTYCPASAVTRDQMAVLLLRTLDPALNPPACGTPMFTDVPANNPYCKWIEELVRGGITGGCAPGLYCPTQAVTRAQMAVFLTTTFSLNLYGL